MTSPLTVPVRYDDVDTNDHVRGPAYLAYADHARWELVRAAGLDLSALARAGLGPVNLQTTVRFRHELRGGDQVAIETTFTYGGGKTGTAHQQMHRVDDGVLVAEVESVTGLLDLQQRRLVGDHAARLLPFVDDPALIGLC